jgi:alkylation response protein AidB-like acyl-CoA dehydrogenase
MAKGFNQFYRLVGHCTTNHDSKGRRLIDVPHVRRKLADVRISLEVGSLMSSRVASMTSKDLDTSWQGSMVKILGSELQVTLAREAVSILGPYGLLLPGQSLAPFDGEFAEAYEFSPVMPIGGGTNEIQRDIVAQRGLGLPRGK